MNFFVIILLWQHILYLCTLFLVQGGKWTLLFLSIDLEIDVFGFQLPIPAYIVKPYGCISF